MSGSNANNRWTLRLSTEGADQVVRDLRAAATESAAAGRAYDTLIKAQPQLATGLERSEQALRKNVDAMRDMRGGYDAGTTSANRFGYAMGQAGFQIQDFAVQVQGGTSALVALSQQGSQLLGVFGTGGAIAGAVLTVGLLGAQLLGAGQATDELKEALDAQKRSMEEANDAGERYTTRLEDQAEAMLRLGASYRTASEAVRTFDAARVNQVQGNLSTQRDAIDNRLFGSLDSTIAARQGVTAAADPLGNLTGFLSGGGRQLAPGLEQLRQALAEFRAESVTTSDAVAALYNRLSTLDTGTASTNARVREAAAGLMAAAPDMMRVADAQREAAVQFLAIREAAGASGQELDRYAARFGTLAGQIRSAATQMNALRQQAIENPLASLNDDIQRAQAVLAAVQAGGREAGLQVQRAQQDQTEITRRATQAQTDFVRALEASGVEASEAAKRGTEMGASFVAAATSAVNGGRAVTAALEPPAAAARNTAAAIRDIQEAYSDLRRDAQSGLLLISDADARAVREISAQIRGTAIDPAVRQRAEQEATRTAEREATRQQAETDRFVSNWGDRLATETTRGLFEGSKKGETFLTRIANSFKNILQSAFSAALSRNVFQPIISSVMGGAGFSGGLSGLFGGSAQAATPGASGGGLNNATSSFGTLRTAYNGLTSPGGLGSFFPGGGAVNTGIGFLDGGLNTALYTPATAGAATPSGFFAGTALPGEAGAFIGGGGAAQSLTLAGSLGPLAAIGGGAYGVYSGIQRGGVGGYTGALGGAVSAATGVGMLGAAAGLLPALGALGPIGLAVGALLAIAGALLPGQQASGRGQEARINLGSGETEFNGLGGSRFSQGNRDAAQSAVGGIADLARKIGDSLSARIGGEVAVGVSSSRGKGAGTLYLDVNGRKGQFSNDENGSKQLAEQAAQFVLDQFKADFAREGRGDAKAAILFNSATATELAQNLDWYENTYKALSKTGEATNLFAQQLQALVKPYDEAISKARSLSLEEGALATKRAEAVAALERDREGRLSDIYNTIGARQQESFGMNASENREAIRMRAERRGAEQEIKQLRAEMEALGASASDTASAIASLEEVQARELARTRSAASQQAAGAASSVVMSLRDYARSLSTTDAGAGTAMDRLAASQRQFDAVFGAAQAGDANSIAGLQSAAEGFRTNARDVFGGGQGYADALRLVEQRITAISDLGAEALTQSFVAENARANTDRIVDALAELRRENAALRSDLNMLLMRPAA